MRRKSPTYHAQSKVSQNMKSAKKAKKMSRSAYKTNGVNVAKNSPMKGGTYLDNSIDNSLNVSVQFSPDKPQAARYN